MIYHPHWLIGFVLHILIIINIVCSNIMQQKHILFLPDL